MSASLEIWQRHIFPLAVLVGAIVAALIIHRLVFRVFRRLTKAAVILPKDSVRKHCSKPLLWLIIIGAVRFALPVLALAEKLETVAEHAFSVLLIGFVSWLLVKSTFVVDDYVVGRLNIEAKDNLRSRKIYTQLRVVKRIIIVIVAIIALATVLMTFPRIRQLGTTILASAGIIGIVVGMAAQKTIGTFIAGLQIAFTQPIRLDDVVIVENEWGRVEEITLTYVVVKIWDLRRLVIPITYFIEKPFQNWTRTTADILGTVYIYVDYTVPIDAVREQLQKILNESDLWDRKVCALQITNTSERGIEMRALVSAADASKAWSLRCEVRERLVDFIGKNYPQSLPKLRVQSDRLKEQ